MQFLPKLYIFEQKQENISCVIDIEKGNATWDGLPMFLTYKITIYDDNNDNYKWLFIVKWQNKIICRTLMRYEYKPCFLLDCNTFLYRTGYLMCWFTRFAGRHATFPRHSILTLS